MQKKCRCHVFCSSILSLVVGCLFFSSTTIADGTFQPVYNPTLEVTKTSHAIKIDGELDDLGWRGAGRADNFAEHRPGDQTKPPVETEALITYDDDHLYVAFVCHDDPSTIRASFCNRDRIFADDNVVLLIDTYADAAWAYEIMANPYGIQGDLLWSKNGGEDERYDLIYESAGKITDAGYQIEMAIPFSGLRFPNKTEQVWKVDFWRNHPRESRAQYSWAAIDRDEPCWPCQWGTVTGIKNVKPGKGIELLPTIVGYQSSALSDGINPGSRFANDDPDGDISFGAKYSVSSAMTAEATYNPDFSQVESDAAQIDVNSTFALFYPERRPFFQEGNDLFNTHFNGVYTRTINDPQFAAKLTGRMNRTSIAYLVARDEHTPITLPFEEESEYLEAKESISNILRARHTFGENSETGLIITDRRLDGGGSGTLAGTDGTLRLAQNYSFEWQVIGSYTEEPNDTALTSDLNDTYFDGERRSAGFDGESYAGHAIYTSVEHHSRNWDLDLDYWERSPTFRADNGFEPTNDRRESDLDVGYTHFVNNDLFEWVSSNVNVGGVWNFGGQKKDEWARVDLSTQLKIAQTQFHSQYLISAEQLSDIQFDGIWGLHLCCHSNASNLLSFGFGLNYGHKIARNEDPPVMGKETGVSSSVDLKPTDRLLLELSFNHVKSDHVDSGEKLFEGFVSRVRTNYQFTRELSMRLVVQYNDFSEKWEVDPLLTYRLNPFSIFYIGSTTDYCDLHSDEGDLQNWKVNSRQFFMKLQYLFQL